MQTITNIDRKPKYEQAATYLFVFKDLKVARQRPYFIISLPSLSESNPLDTTKLMKTYLELTAKLRAPDERQLFITFVKPHCAISTDTVSRWVRQTLSHAGTDSKVFGANSVRGASASAASGAGAPLNTT